MTMKVETTRPDMSLLKNGELVSNHRDLAEAIQRAANEGEGNYEVVQPTIRIMVRDED